MTAFAYFKTGKTYEISGDLKTANEYFKKVLSLQKELRSKYLAEDIDSIKAFTKKYKQQLE